MRAYMFEQLSSFLVESNKIEGIPYVKDGEMQLAQSILDSPVLKTKHIEDFVHHITGGAALRAKAGMNVRIGNLIPVTGGIHVKTLFQELIDDVNVYAAPYEIHNKYETLHPFMDGNGRSGRLIWAWQMLHFNIHPGLERGFLHEWYYQSLREHRLSK